MGNSQNTPPPPSAPRPNRVPPAPPVKFSPESPRCVTLDVVASARDQFVAFCCGTLVPRTRARSPASVLSSQTPLVAEFGRSWVVRPYSDTVIALKGAVKWGSADDFSHTVHVWLCLSPTVGVVRSVRLESFVNFRVPVLAGCIRDQDTARRIQPDEVATLSNLPIGEERLLQLRRGTPAGVYIVDERDSMVRSLSPCELFTPPIVFCNSRWIVLLFSTMIEMTLWRLCDLDPDGDFGDGKLFTEDCQVKVKMDIPAVLDAALCESDPDVLLIAVPKSTSDSVTLLHIDLRESFRQKTVVHKTEPITVPLSPSGPITVFGGNPVCVVSQGSTSLIHNLHNTITNETCTIEGKLQPLEGNIFSVCDTPIHGPTTTFKIFHTADPKTPFLVIPWERRVPGTVDGLMTLALQRNRGVFVWECSAPLQCRNSLSEGTVSTETVEARYAITHAETDTLLAFIDYHRKGDY